MSKSAPFVLFLMLAGVGASGYLTAEPLTQTPATHDQQAMIHFTGKVVHLEIEGGFWGLKADDGKNYDPLDLPSQFQVEGLRVEGTLRVEKDIATIHMWGTPVRVMEIKRAGTAPASNSTAPRNPR